MSGVQSARTLVVVCESYQITKVELLQEHTRDKVRRQVTLLVPARCYGTIGQTGTAGVRSARTLVVVRMLISQIDDNGRLREVIIRCLMDQCQ